MFRAEASQPYGYIIKPAHDHYLLFVVSNVLKRIELEKKLHARLESQKLLSAVSTQFISVQSDHIRTEFYNALELLGNHLGVDSVSVF